MEVIFRQQREWRKLFIIYLTSNDKVDEEKTHTIKKYLKYIDKYRRGELETIDLFTEVYMLCSNYFASDAISVVPLGTCQYLAGIIIRMNRISIKSFNTFWENTNYPSCILGLVEMFLGTDINAFHTFHIYLQETLNNLL